MAKIMELDPNLADQIAAGEVVERPASVVKELVENAIDARASRISVSVEESGLKSIIVVDDGEGIASEDVPLALRSHATSKIKTSADLFRIRTLGFRGEALPSIASVSDLTIETSVIDEEAGSFLRVKGGEIVEHKPASKRQGSKITVENLFFNTPARLKYMKSMQVELSHITDIINRQSLAHPEIAFTLINDGKNLLRTSGNGDLKQALAGVYGLSSAKKTVEISASDLDFELTGYISLPELTRANRNYITILINGRYVKNFLLNRALIQGYGSKLMVGRFPLAVIDIKLDPYLADVNVHPTKQEVRLSKERELMALLEKAVAEALAEESLIPSALDNLTKKKTPKPEQTRLELKPSNLYYDKSEGDFFVKEDSRFDFQADKSIQSENLVQDILPSDKQDSSNQEPTSSAKFAQPEIFVQEDGEHPNFSSNDGKSHKTLSRLADKLETEEDSAFPELEFFGQMHGTYLFAQGNDGLYIVDQHAAQERIKYEYYRESIGQVDDMEQQLLVPYIFDFPMQDAIKIREKLPLLAEMGINLLSYGDKQFILREHPTWLDESEIEGSIYQMVDMLLNFGQVSVKDYRAELAIMMSCKRSIKANHWLDDVSARQLLAELATCKNPYNCPHGRPVLVHFSKGDMEQMFRRIQENHKGGWNLEF